MLLLHCNSKQLHIFPLTEIVARDGRIPLLGPAELYTSQYFSTWTLDWPSTTSAKWKTEINKG